jgi:hypothetical protein
MGREKRRVKAIRVKLRASRGRPKTKAVCLKTSGGEPEESESKKGAETEFCETAGLKGAAGTGGSSCPELPDIPGTAGFCTGRPDPAGGFTGSMIF